MRKYVLLLLVLFLSGFVIAQSSEVVTNFSVNKEVIGKDYVSPVSFWDVSGEYIVGLIVILVIIVIIKMRSSKVSKRKVSKRKIKKKK